MRLVAKAIAKLDPGYEAVLVSPLSRARETAEPVAAACGFERMEIGSFVSPKAIAQMADIVEILKQSRLPKTLIPQVLVPNRKGFEAALAVGMKEIGWVISVSEPHNQNNVRRSVDQSFDDLAACWKDVGGPHGYAEFLRILLTPEEDEIEQQRQFKRWSGGRFDPERFDLAKTDKAVRGALRKRREQ